MYKYIYLGIFGDYLCKTINPNIPNSSPDVACLTRLILIVQYLKLLMPFPCAISVMMTTSVS